MKAFSLQYTTTVVCAYTKRCHTTAARVYRLGFRSVCVDSSSCVAHIYYNWTSFLIYSCAGTAHCTRSCVRYYVVLHNSGIKKKITIEMSIGRNRLKNVSRRKQNTRNSKYYYTVAHIAGFSWLSKQIHKYQRLKTIMQSVHYWIIYAWHVLEIKTTIIVRVIYLWVKVYLNTQNEKYLQIIHVRRTYRCNILLHGQCNIVRMIMAKLCFHYRVLNRLNKTYSCVTRFCWLYGTEKIMFLMIYKEFLINKTFIFFIKYFIQYYKVRLWNILKKITTNSRTLMTIHYVVYWF